MSRAVARKHLPLAQRRPYTAQMLRCTEFSFYFFGFFGFPCRGRDESEARTT